MGQLAGCEWPVRGSRSLDGFCIGIEVDQGVQLLLCLTCVR